MKKFFTALLALCITASMTGCSPEPKTPLEGKIMEEAAPEEFFSNPKSPRAKEFLSKVL